MCQICVHAEQGLTEFPQTWTSKITRNIIFTIMRQVFLLKFILTYHGRSWCCRFNYCHISGSGPLCWFINHQNHARSHFTKQQRWSWAASTGMGLQNELDAFRCTAKKISRHGIYSQCQPSKPGWVKPTWTRIIYTTSCNCNRCGFYPWKHTYWSQPGWEISRSQGVSTWNRASAGNAEKC